MRSNMLRAGYPTPTHLEGEVRFLQSQDQQVTTRSPRQKLSVYSLALSSLKYTYMIYTCIYSPHQTPRRFLLIHLNGPRQTNLVLIACTSSESRGTFKQKARSLAPLNGWECGVKICHDGMLEDTNSLDGAQMSSKYYRLLPLLLSSSGPCYISSRSLFNTIMMNITRVM